MIHPLLCPPSFVLWLCRFFSFRFHPDSTFSHSLSFFPTPPVLHRMENTELIDTSAESARECVRLMLENCTCSICTGIWTDPATCTRCDTVWCRACIESWIERNPSCPNCRGPATSDNINKNPRLAQRQLAALPLLCACPHCDWKGRTAMLNDHLRTQCPENLVDCPEDGCQYRAPAFRIEEHRSDCRWRKLSCTNCFCEYVYSERKAHAASCPGTNANSLRELGRSRMKIDEGTGPIDALVSGLRQLKIDVTLSIPIQRFQSTQSPCTVVRSNLSHQSMNERFQPGPLMRGVEAFRFAAHEGQSSSFRCTNFAFAPGGSIALAVSCMKSDGSRTNEIHIIDRDGRDALAFDLPWRHGPQRIASSNIHDKFVVVSEDFTYMLFDSSGNDGVTHYIAGSNRVLDVFSHCDGRLMVIINLSGAMNRCTELYPRTGSVFIDGTAVSNAAFTHRADAPIVLFNPIQEKSAVCGSGLQECCYYWHPSLSNPKKFLHLRHGFVVLTGCGDVYYTEHKTQQPYVITERIAVDISVRHDNHHDSFGILMNNNQLEIYRCHDCPLPFSSE